MIPCDYCKIPIDSDVYEEELGMCLDCSNAYWSHNYDYLESVMSVVGGKVEV
jgi:sugar phosphate isomerase/epimerase